MFKTIASAVAALAMGAAAGSAGAQPADLGRFDARKAQDVAERMVLCDVTLFLASDPDLNARRMYAVRRSAPPELLIGPYFVGPGRWYDEDLEIASRLLRSRGQISWAQLDAVHRAHTPEMVRTFGRRGGIGVTGQARRFIRDQARFCSRFARDVRLGA